MVQIVFLIGVLLLATFYGTRNYQLWRASFWNIVSARNALDSNILLLETALEFDSDMMRSARAERIVALKEECAAMTAEVNELEKSSFIEKVIFGKKRAVAIESLAIGWNLKLRTSICGTIDILNNWPTEGRT